MLTMTCPRIPSSKAREAIERTRSDEKEHGFVVCGDGSTGEILDGDDDSLDIENPCSPDDDELVIFHTHPNGVKRLSKADKEVAARDDVNAVCVGAPDGTFMCRTDKKCESEVNVDE